MCTCLFPENQVMVFQYINDATDKVREKHPRMEANVWAKVYVEYMYNIDSKHVKWLEVGNLQTAVYDMYIYI